MKEKDDLTPTQSRGGKRVSKPMSDLIEVIHFTEDVATKIHGLLDEAEIYKTVIEEFAKSKRYHVSIVLLTADGSKLRTVGVSKPPEVLKAAEKATGLRLEGYEIDLDKSSIYSQVVRGGETVEAKVSDVICELFPRRLASLVLKIMGYEKVKSILTPIYRQGKIIGALAVDSTELAEHYIPSVKLLAKHISNALQMAGERAERERLVEALRESREKFERLFTDNPEATVYLGPDHQILDINPRFEELFGYSLDEIKGKHLNDVVVPKEKMKEAEMLDKKCMQERVYLETVRKRRDGSLVSVSISASPITINDQRMGYIAIYRDITELVEAKQALEEARLYAESIVDTVREPLIVLDADLRVVSASHSYYHMFKTTPEETESHLIYELDDRQWDVPELRRLLGEVILKKTFFEDFEVEHDFPRIGRRVMLLNARRIRREANETPLILLAIEDITERKRLEEKIREFTFRENKVVPGESYIVESHDRAYHVYAALTMHGVPGLCFARGNPKKLIQEYTLTKDHVLLLSGRPLFGFEAVADLQEISIRISNFLEKNNDSVILIDGLEYLFSRFGFDAIYRFIQEKVYDAVEANAVLLFPVDPKAFSEREKALITSELHILQ